LYLDFILPLVVPSRQVHSFHSDLSSELNFVSIIIFLQMCYAHYLSDDYANFFSQLP